MAQNSGGPIVVAALIIGGSIIAGALLVRSSVDGAAQKVAGLEDALGSLQVAAAPARAPSRPSRPDPSRRYSVNTKGSPVKGNPDAKLAVVEFSDFQCPFCSRVTPTHEPRSRTDLRRQGAQVVFKHLPLSIHSEGAGGPRRGRGRPTARASSGRCTT